MRVAVAISVVAWVGCYNPSPKAGAPCATDTECPGDQKCVGGLCGGTVNGTDSGSVDVAIDSPMIPLCQQWSPKHFDPCAIPMPTSDLDLTTTLSGFSF